MSLAKTNWGLNLNSGDTIEGLGAIIISRRKVDNGGNFHDVSMQQFAIVSSLGGLDYDIRWRQPFFVYTKDFSHHRNQSLVFKWV